MRTLNAALLIAPILLIGCQQGPNSMLIFGQTQTLGITVNGSTTSQSAELTVGFRDFDIAVVPTSVAKANGEPMVLKGSVKPGNDKNSTDSEDAFSVLGQFDANAKAGTPEVSLGKFFATGVAAKRLADGFAEKMSGAPADKSKTTK